MRIYLIHDVKEQRIVKAFQSLIRAREFAIQYYRHCYTSYYGDDEVKSTVFDFIKEFDTYATAGGIAESEFVMVEPIDVE